MLDGLDLASLEAEAQSEVLFPGGLRETISQLALGQLTLDFDQTLQLLASRFLSALKGSAWRLTRLAAPAALWGVLCRLHRQGSEAGRMVCLLMVCAFLSADLNDHAALCLESVERMSGGMQGLFPLLLTALSAVGGSAGSALMQPAVVASAGAMVNLIRHVTLPLCVCFAVLTMLCHLGGGLKLNHLCALSHRAANWTLGVGFTVFIGVMATRGFAASAVDGVALRTAKYALDNFVPVVGGLFADTVDTLIGSGLLVQGALGITGLLLLCGWCLSPLCQTFASALIYKLAAALLQPFADGDLTDCIHDFSQVLMLLFVIQLCAAAMYLLLIGQIVGLGSATMMLR